MLEIKQYKEIKKYKRYIPFDLNAGSKLYYDKDIIYKIPISINPNFKEILKYIDNLNINELLELKNIIYKKNKIVGYSFKNYKQYKSLRRLKNRNLKLKKEDCFKIIKTYDLLAKNNLRYSDFHRGNVLVNEITNDIKICDFDNFSISQDKDLSKYQLRCSIILCLAYLYNINYYDIRNVINAKGINNSNNQINKFCKDNNISIDEYFSLIDKFDFNLIKTERKEIIGNSKKLCKTGYCIYRRF